MGDNLAMVNVGVGRTAVEVSAASGIHSCALLDDGTVKCWGSGAYGELGYDTTSTRGDEPNEMGDILPAVDLGSAP